MTFNKLNTILRACFKKSSILSLAGILGCAPRSGMPPQPHSPDLATLLQEKNVACYASQQSEVYPLNDLRCSIQRTDASRESKAEAGECTVFQIAVENLSESAMSVTEAGIFISIQFEILNGKGAPVNLTQQGRQAATYTFFHGAMGGYTSVPPKGRWERKIRISDFYDISKPDIYTVQCRVMFGRTRDLMKDRAVRWLQSNAVRLQVVGAKRGRGPFSMLKMQWFSGSIRAFLSRAASSDANFTLILSDFLDSF